MKIRTYSELVQLKTFEERFDYLKLGGKVGETTFGFDRYVNQRFYQSQEWARIRNEIIVRDNGCDLGLEGYEIYGTILIHHLNPITLKDVTRYSEYLREPEYLIVTRHSTHNAIHYGDKNLLVQPFIERARNDTCPWKK